MADQEYEYGIDYADAERRQIPQGDPAIAGLDSEDKARGWVQGFYNDGWREGVFVIVRRPIGKWEEVK